MLSQSGVEHISQLKIDFNPFYAQVIVPGIRVFREEVWLGPLEQARYKLIQRETGLENKLYRADLTLVYFLDDIREGDIVEYAYPIVGELPFFSSHCVGKVCVQRDFPVAAIKHRLLAHPDVSFLMRSGSTTIEPQITDISPSLREWSWEVSETLPYSYECGEPNWYHPPAHIEMSQYTSWEEVAKKLYPPYVLPSNFSEVIPSNMQALVGSWKNSAKGF